MRLSPLEHDDADDFLAALGNNAEAAEVLEHFTFAAPRDLGAVHAVIQQALDTPDRRAYTQRLRSTGQFVGCTSFYEIDPVLRALAIGQTWLGRRYWRTGVNTESKLIMLRRAFDELGAERVVWHTDIRNVRSQAAIERLGAQLEGVLRHHRIRPDGSWRDTVQFSMLSAEWPAARARLQERLARAGSVPA